MIILTHIGESLPEYLNTFLIQLRKFNIKNKIIFLVNKCNTDNPIFIERHQWHRVIKGTGKLLLKINKLKTNKKWKQQNLQW